MDEDITQKFPQNGFRQIIVRLDALDARLATLEEKVDRRLQDTRPIWEQVLARLDTIDGRLDSIDGRLDRVEIRLDRVDREVYNLNKRFRFFHQDILKLQDSDDDLDERLRRLESSQGIEEPRRL